MRTVDEVNKDIEELRLKIDEISSQKRTVKAEYSDAIEKLQQEDSRLRKEMYKLRNEHEGIIVYHHKKKLFEENGYEIGDPIAEKVYAKAWDRGHSNGLSEVASEFEDLLELFSDNA